MSRRFIRLPELQQLTGLSRSSIYNRLGRSAYSDPDFPRPVSLSSKKRGAVAWDLAEVETWMTKRVAAR